MENKRALVVAGFPAARRRLADALLSLRGRFALVFEEGTFRAALLRAPSCDVIVVDDVVAEGGVGPGEVKQLRGAMKGGAKLLVCIEPGLAQEGVLKMVGADAVLSRNEVSEKTLLRALGEV